MNKKLKYGLIDLLIIAVNVVITLLLIDAFATIGNPIVTKFAKAILWAIHAVIDLIIACFYTWFCQCEDWWNNRHSHRGNGLW